VDEERTLVTGEHNKEKTKELDWACITQRLTAEDSFGGPNDGEEGSRKTENNDVGLDEEQRSRL